MVMLEVGDKPDKYDKSIEQREEAFAKSKMSTNGLTAEVGRM